MSEAISSSEGVEGQEYMDLPGGSDRLSKLERLSASHSAILEGIQDVITQTNKKLDDLDGKVSRGREANYPLVLSCIGVGISIFGLVMVAIFHEQSELRSEQNKLSEYQREHQISEGHPVMVDRTSRLKKDVDSLVHDIEVLTQYQRSHQMSEGHPVMVERTNRLQQDVEELKGDLANALDIAERERNDLDTTIQREARLLDDKLQKEFSTRFEYIERELVKVEKEVMLLVAGLKDRDRESTKSQAEQEERIKALERAVYDAT